MECGLELSAHDQEKTWYVDGGYSKHMTWDKNQFLSLKEKDRGNNVMLDKNALAKIKGKGIVSLDENTKAQNVLYVEGLKHN